MEDLKHGTTAVGVDFRKGIRAGELSSDNSSGTASISSSSSLSSSDDNNHAKKQKDDVWYIHGNGYDLMDFVEEHPGGKEAILLGKGRDCTALVESYHAFSGDRVWKILEKHRVAEDDDDVDSSATGRVPDFFYELLKKRVTKVLRSKGIDPIRDRGASKVRITYYMLVFVSWLYTGYLHCTVSTMFFRWE